MTYPSRPLRRIRIREPHRCFCPQDVISYNMDGFYTLPGNITVDTRGGRPPPRFTYDAMGNPTSYLGKTLTWDGKQLKKAEFGSGTSYCFYEYKYDENGLRARKTFSAPALSLSETTEYYYNGSVLIGMKIGTGSSAKILRFSYDANGSVVAVDYSTDNGSNFTTYYYLRNAQNDIVKIIDSTGTTVVEYIYDSWGKALSVTGSLTNSLGLDQPFRYRGYVYDNETSEPSLYILNEVFTIL